MLKPAEQNLLLHHKKKTIYVDSDLTLWINTLWTGETKWNCLACLTFDTIKFSGNKIPSEMSVTVSTALTGQNVSFRKLSLTAGQIKNLMKLVCLYA